MMPLREKSESLKIMEQFFKKLDNLSEEDLISFVDYFLNRKLDKKLAIKELHITLNKFNNVANNFYLFFNNQYYFPSLEDSKMNEEEYFTVEEVSKKFNISEKTIYNWEKAGLKIKRPSPRILIISKKDLFNFFESNT